MAQHVLSEGKLLNARGELCEAGYATTLIKAYDRNDIKAGKSRIKEWDYYLIYNDRFGVALTLDDNSYMGLISASFLDFISPSERTVSKMFWLPFGKTEFPSTSQEGDVEKMLSGAYASFVFEDGKRHLRARIEDFGTNHSHFACDLVLTEEPKDSMVIATPFAERPTAFYYNQKIVGFRAEGYVMYNDERYEFRPEDSFGILDWGRGVWTYRNTWYWSAACGMVDGHLLGFNLGYGFGDTSAATENMLFFDGKAHKLNHVVFEIPQKDGKDDFMSPWRVRDDEGRLEFSFVPILNRRSKTDVGIICSDQNQIFGHFHGWMRLDDGTKVELKDFLGFAEKVHNRW